MSTIGRAATGYLMGTASGVIPRKYLGEGGTFLTTYASAGITVCKLRKYSFNKVSVTLHNVEIDDTDTVMINSNRTGVGDTSGPLWRAQRKTMVEILRQFGMGKNIMAEKVQSEVDEFVKALGSKDAQSFDPSKLVQVSASNNICSILFGQRFDYDDDHFLKLVEAMEEMFKVTGGASATAVMPILRYVPGDPFKVQKAIDCYNYIVDTFLIPAIKQHVQNYREDQQDDFISAYLREAKLAPQKGTADYVNGL